MKTTRREFMHSIAAMTALGLLPRFARASRVHDELFFANKPLRGGAFMIGDLPTGGNVLAMPCDRGAIVVDAKHAHLGSDLVHDVQSLCSKGPSLLINTHHHADHTGGNWAFADDANIVAHRNMNPRIDANIQRYVQGAANRASELKESGADEATVKAAEELAAKIKSLDPKKFKAKQDLTDGINLIDHGGVSIRCYHYGNGHTDNDIVVFFPKPNILHMGDLVFHNLHPFIDRIAKANTISWQKSLREAMKLGDKDTIVVPGHGELTDMTALPKQIEYFDRLREVITKAIDEGKTREEVTAIRPDVFKDYGFDQIRPIAFGGMFDEIMASRS